MDFFDAQDHARKLSHRLVALYGLAVALLIVGTYLVVAFVFGVTMTGGGGFYFDPALFAGVAIGMGVVIGGGAAVRTAQLRQGGAKVAELLGGRRVDPATADPREQVLMNVVEEMAIASGVPVPEVFVLDREEGINAFAAGHTLNDAAVAVTRGALDAFTRDELQGVMAHEFSHILNGDMRLNVRIMGLLFGILLLTVIGRGIVRGTMYGGGRSRRGSGGRDGGGGQIVLIGVALIVLGYLGVLVGRIIQAAVSRQREFLADAAAVEFTRNPAGIAGALIRIGAASGGSRIRDHHAEEAGHLFFARGLGRGLAGLTATHPPLPARIRRIDPAWDGTLTPLPGRPLGEERVRPVGARGRAGQVGAVPGTSGTGAPGAGGQVFGGPGAAILPIGDGPERGALLAAILASAGTLPHGQVAWARTLLDGIPDETRRRLRTPEGAVEAILALLLPKEGAHGAELEGGAYVPGGHAQGVELITRRLGERTATGAAELAPVLATAGGEARLPLVELALPGLRTLPRERAVAFRDVVAGLAALGDGVRPFAYAVHHLVRRNLPAGVDGELPSRRLGSTSLSRLARESEVLLTAVARSGSAAEDSFGAGAARLAGEVGELRFLPAGAVDLASVDGALSRFEGAKPDARRELLAAAAMVVEADGEVELDEAELLRAIAEALEVPIPPLGVLIEGGVEGSAEHRAEPTTEDPAGHGTPDRVITEEADHG